MKVKSSKKYSDSLLEISKEEKQPSLLDDSFFYSMLKTVFSFALFVVIPFELGSLSINQNRTAEN